MEALTGAGGPLVKLNTVFKLGMSGGGGGGDVRNAVSNSERERKHAKVKELLTALARDESGERECVSLRFVLRRVLDAADTAHRAARTNVLHTLTPRCDTVGELRVLAKCVKVIARASAKIYEHKWWCEEARAKSTASLAFPLANLPAVGEGQPYLALYSAAHANIAFLVRTGSFNPMDVLERHGGELACRLCGEARGDNAVHLLGWCAGSERKGVREKLVQLRREASALFAAQFTDWKQAVMGLVAKTKGVSTSVLSRERVIEGCELLYRLYCLRKDHGVGGKRVAREQDAEND
jgi:hypothetical protein